MVAAFVKYHLMVCSVTTCHARSGMSSMMYEGNSRIDIPTALPLMV